MDRDALAVEAASVPVIDAFVVVETGEVEIANVAVVAPPRTVTFVGTEAFRELDDRVTAVPPAGDAPLRVTVPVEPAPPTTEVGETVNEVIVSDETVTVRV